MISNSSIRSIARCSYSLPLSSRTERFVYLFRQVTLRFVNHVRGGLLTKMMDRSYPVVSYFDKTIASAGFSGSGESTFTGLLYCWPATKSKYLYRAVLVSINQR